MPDLYEKLGDLLNDVLESGKIPEENIISEAQKVDRKTENQSQTDSTGPFSFNQTTSSKTTYSNTNSTKSNTSQNIATGSIIRNYNYEQQIVYPPEIVNAAGFLGLNFPFTKEELRIKYHNLLKQNHPDKENGSNLNLSVQQITAAYDLLKSYFFPAP